MTTATPPQETEEEGPPPRPGRTSQPGHQALLAAASLVVLLAGIKAAAGIINPVLLATLLTAGTWPLVRRLERFGLPIWAAVAAVLTAVIAVLAAIGALVGVAVAGLARRVPQYREDVRKNLVEPADAFLEERLALDLDLSLVSEELGPEALLNLLGGVAGSLSAAGATGIVVLLFLAFSLLEAAGFERKLGAASRDPGWLPRARKIASEINKYLRVKTVISLATGVVLGLFTWAMGLDLPILWGLLAFFLNYIPTIGSAIAAVPPVGLALISLGPLPALGVGVGYIVVNTVIGNMIEPWIMGDALDLSPLVVTVALFFFGWLLGTTGALLSAPLAMAIRIMLGHLPDLAWVATLMGPPLLGDEPEERGEGGPEESGESGPQQAGES